VCSANSFFQDCIEVTKQKMISIDAKILISLKYLAYGCSVNAFHNYFQLGKTTSMLCVKKFIKILPHSELCDIYLSSMTPMDAKKVETYHQKVYGIRGMIGLLDCSHVV
jgi:nucleoside permease NupC